MARKRIILEMGTGNDLYGEDYTKAANRAVQDALHHSSISLFKSLDIDPASMQVEVTVGVQKPGEVDTDAVAATLPHGDISVTAVEGGMNLLDEVTGRTTVVATVGVAAWLDIPDKWAQK